MAATIRIPTSHNDPRTYEVFFKLYNDVMIAAEHGDDIELDFTWALARGNTSKPGNRGVGLDILRSFVELNRGNMDVVSHRGHVRITDSGPQSLRRNHAFPGTVFNITFKADERRYAFKSEIDAEGIF